MSTTTLKPLLLGQMLHTTTPRTAASQIGQATFHYIRPDSTKIIFQGLNQTELLEFVHAIRHKAIQQGKQRDDEWLADYAAICFFGEALLWHLGLPEEVQGSWKLLLRALMEKYTGPKSALIPTPAAASPQAASPGVIATQVPANPYDARSTRSGGPRGTASAGFTRSVGGGFDSVAIKKTLRQRLATAPIANGVVEDDEWY